MGSPAEGKEPTKTMRKKPEYYCLGCGEPTEPVKCVEHIDDFCCGRPSCQVHEYEGSACCGEEVISRRDSVQERWDDRCRLKRIGELVESLNAARRAP